MVSRGYIYRVASMIGVTTAVAVLTPVCVCVCLLLVQVDHALGGGPLHEVLVSAFNTKLTRKDLIVSREDALLSVLIHVLFVDFDSVRAVKYCESVLVAG